MHAVDGDLVGLTRDAGWQIGVAGTVPHPLQHVWSVLLSERGLALWLGPGVACVPAPGGEYRTRNGTVGVVRSLRPSDRVRLTWRPAAWDHDSTVQVAVREAGDTRTLLRFHQERLADRAERTLQHDHWRSVLAAMRVALDA